MQRNCITPITPELLMGNVEDKFSLKRLLKQSHLRTPKTKKKSKQEDEKHELELHP